MTYENLVDFGHFGNRLVMKASEFERQCVTNDADEAIVVIKASAYDQT